MLLVVRSFRLTASYSHTHSHTAIAIPLGNICSDPMNQIIHKHILKGDINFNCLDRLYMGRAITNAFRVSYSLAITLCSASLGMAQCWCGFDLRILEITSAFVHSSPVRCVCVCVLVDFESNKAHLFYCILDYVR